MTLTTIIIIILLGIFLFFIEFFIIPGISIAGIAGFLMVGGGTYAAFHYLGPKIGFIVLALSTVVTLFMFAFVFRSKTWRKAGLETAIDSKFQSFDTNLIKVGDTGVTVSKLAPMGKAMVNGIMCEAKSTFGYIDENSEIVVTKIENTKIIVKLKNN